MLGIGLRFGFGGSGWVSVQVTFIVMVRFGSVFRPRFSVRARVGVGVRVGVQLGLALG